MHRLLPLPFALALLPFLLACPEVKPLHQRNEHRVLALKSGGRLDLDNFKGSIRVEPWDREELEVQFEIREHREGSVQILTEARADQAILRVQNTETRRGWSFFPRTQDEADLKLKVPRKAYLVLATRHGDVEARDLEGTFEIRTTHGRVELARLNGNADVQTTHGEVQLRHIQGEVSVRGSHTPVNAEDLGKDLRVASTHGEIQVRRLGGRADLETTHACIQLDEVHGPAEARTTHGSVLASTIQGDLRVRTTHARVEVSRIQGGVDVESSHGAISAREVKGNGRGVTLRTSHAPITLSSRGLDGLLVAPASALDLPGDLNAKVQRNGQQARVQLGKGGQSISLETSHGRVTVE